MSTGVSVRGLSKRYGPTAAVDGLDLDAEPGRITGLLGRNGAGKTTTLECLLGLRQPDAGTITVDGVDARADPAAAKRRVGAQLQATALQDRLTPREALRFFASFYRDALRPDDLLARFDLVAKADHPFATLSVGQRQRLAVALAFVNDPPVLVLDEPTAGLDPHARRGLHGLIDGFRSDGRTVLLSTHDIAEAQRLCDHVVVMDGGRVVAAGRPADLISRVAAAAAVVFRTSAPLPPATLPSAEPTPDGYRLPTADTLAGVTAVAAACAAAGVDLLDIAVRHPSLEDAFLHLTRGSA